MVIGNIPYQLRVVLFCVVLLVGCRAKKEDGLPDMQVTLASNDIRPMGGKVFRTLVSKLFSVWLIENNARPFDQWYQNYLQQNYHQESSLYMIVSPAVVVRQKEAEQMKRFAERGNTLFIISDFVDEEFKKVFKVGIARKPDSVVTNVYGLTDTYKSMLDTLQFPHHSFHYYFFPLTASIESSVENITDSISVNMNGQLDGVRVRVGAGELILITNAEAVSNYFLLSGENYRYAAALLSFINQDPEEIFWDEFYRRNLNRQPENQSIFDAILALPALRWAFWLLLGLCLLAILTNLFRRQRLVPVRAPNRNTTVEFTQTIARLYYNKRDNRNIALKMIQHFLEHLRTRYYIPHQKLDEGFAAVLAGKTNQPLPEMERLVKRMSAIQQGAEVSDEILLELNRQFSELLRPVEMAS